MSTKIKSTLYRFVTMRAPELVESETVQKNFVQHPEMDKLKTSSFDSVFLNAVYKLPDNKTRKQYLKETAATFATSALKDRDDVRTLAISDLYDFAIWLTANRTTLKKEDVENQINFSSGVARQIPLSSSLIATDFITLWDNLFYQIITFKSSYVREAILSVLVAEQFLKQYNNTIESTKVLRKMAQMRIIVPNDLFNPQSNALAVASRKNALKSLPVVNKKLSKELEYNMLDKNIAFYNDTLKQIEKLEKEYNSNNKKAQTLAYKQYQNNVASLYANATKADKIITYPNTTFTKTIKEYVNLEIPPFSFEPALELDLSVLRSKLNDETYAFIDSVIDNNESITSFLELKEFITDTLSKDVQKQFEETKFGTAFSTTNGFVMPMVSRPDSNDPNYFAIAGNSYTDNVALTLLFNNVYHPAGLEVLSADYSFTFDNGTPVNSTTFQEQWINGKLQVTLSNANFDFTGKDSVSVDGFLLLSNATKINFTGTATISFDIRTNSYKVFGDGTYENEALDPIGDNGNTGTTGSDENIGNDTPTEIAVLDYIPSGYGIKRLGIADYRKVEQEVSCYVPGEISHIENVMAREYKEKSTRRLRRQEDTVTTSKEKETEKLSDTTSTDRFEMNQEVNSIIAEQNSANVGSQISWKGKVDGIAHADFAHNTSQETSNLEAITNAKEITERALERVVQKVKEERITKIIEEFEENTKHGFDNRKGNQHVSGVYRWIDKIFKNRIVNYGKRLTYEFMIPEPASFHNEASRISAENPSTEMLVKPIDPRVGVGNLKITSSKDVTLLNYQKWASLYNADVNSLKEATITVGKGFNLTGNEDNFENASGNGEVRIPDGYVAYEGKIDFSAAEDDTNLNGKAFFVSLGDYSVENVSNTTNTINSSFGYFNIDNFSNAVPVSFVMQDYYQGKVNVSVRCKLTEEVIEQWKTETFNTIIEAYEDQLAAYNQKIEQLKTSIKTKVKSNPLFYRQIENTVLRKNCIEYLISHNALGEKSLITGDTVKDIHVKYDDAALETYATKVKFFEQAFEWDLMSYYFYPFYWAEKKKWKELYNVDESDDSIFRAFLQSGMARVILTVRPGFEEAVNWYMATGQVWNGGQVPTFNDELFISIIEELREPEGTVEETWESRVPTSLTVIQAGSIGLNVQGLPCDDDCSQYNQFDSDGSQVFNPDGTPVIVTNPIAQSLGSDGNPVNLGNITDELVEVSESIEEIQADIEEIKTTLDTIAAANN